MALPSSPNLWQGVQLVQVGRKAEALPYLRYAARHEWLNAEGWLWLAAASDDREEYRHCIQQALGLDPGHPVARQMRQAIEAQDSDLAQRALPSPGYGLYTPPYALPGLGTATPGGSMSRVRPRLSWKRRALRALLLLLILGGLVGGAVVLVESGVVQRAWDDWNAGEVRRSLEFAVGEDPGFPFRMTVPDTWMPANTDNVTWRTRRDALAEAFGLAVEGSVWQQVSTPFSAVVRDPVYGRVLPAARVVETDEDRLRVDGAVTALTLNEIPAFPAAVLAQTASLCDRMRAIEADYRVDATGITVLESRVVTRNGDDCALVVERAITDTDRIVFPITRELAPATMREILIAVPVGHERYALWRLTMAEDAVLGYRPAIERLVETLVYTGE